MHQPFFKNILFVINPISGGIDKDELDHHLEAFCSSCGISHSFFRTTGENDKRKIKDKIKDNNPDAVIAIGGDGTVNLVASILAGTDMCMGILPMGSGNGLAKDLNIPQNDPEAAMEVLRNPTIKKIDTLKVNGHFFVHLCDLGFNAHVVKMFSRSEHRGLLSYMRFTVMEFFSYHSFKYRLSVDTQEEDISGKAFMITCANSNKYGSNIVINPEGHMTDGAFEVVVIKDFKWYKVFKMIALLVIRRIHTWELTQTVRCKKARIVLRKKKTLQYDGELGEKVKEIQVSVLPGNLKVICPTISCA
ncbi:diacylglycerol kinase family protein [Roseivirga sp. BDSF3-8]|uniref:diacylglycerol/lipid kinase family protein n=1 Tax=Roseivirga sp. BDSF3-8 TaxID=3241598 RepID=UPI003531A28E